MDEITPVAGLNITSTQLSLVLLVLIAFFILLTIRKGVKIVPQAENWVVERLGRFRRVLEPGLRVIVPYLDSVKHEISILERQLPDLKQDAITKDNVVIQCVIAVFYRVSAPEKTVYRIRDVDGAVSTTIAGIVRSEIGKLDLDEVQSNRAALNGAIKVQLADATSDWGVAVTRAEVLDVDLDDTTREAMLQQLNAERARRAAVMKAEGAKQAVQLEADAELYTAERKAEARRVQADADAYATRIVAEAIEQNGQGAIEFEVRKRQVEAVAELAKTDGARTIILPADMADAFGTAAKFFGRK